MCMTKKVQVKENERHLSSPNTSHQYVTALSLLCFCVGDKKKNQKLCLRSQATVHKWTLFNAVHGTLYQGQHCQSTGHLKHESCNTWMTKLILSHFIVKKRSLIDVCLQRNVKQLKPDEACSSVKSLKYSLTSSPWRCQWRFFIHLCSEIVNLKKKKDIWHWKGSKHFKLQNFNFFWPHNCFRITCPLWVQSSAASVDYLDMHLPLVPTSVQSVSLFSLT